MKGKRKPVTKELIRHYFGRDAKVHGFAGHYRVTTPMGGEVVITANKIRLIYGGDDVYRAMTLLIGHCWGGGKAEGSREYVLASVAHGEAWDVDIQPDFRDKGATYARWCTAILVFVIGCMMLVGNGGSGAGSDNSGLGAVIVCVLPFAIFFLMKRKARREEQRKLETGGFTYPRQAHGAEYADDEQLRKGGLI